MLRHRAVPQFDLDPVHAVQVGLPGQPAQGRGHRQPHHGIDEGAGARTPSHAGAPFHAAGQAQRAAAHLDRTFRLGRIVEIDRAQRQAQRHAARCIVGRSVQVEQQQLAAGMAQPLGHHIQLSAEPGFVGALQPLLLVGQQLQHQRGAAHQQADEHQPQQRAAQERCRRQARQLQRAEFQRKPRMGTFSMPSKAGSISRRASRMVATCLRTLSLLRPVFTTS